MLEGRQNIVLADCEAEEVMSFSREMRFDDQPFVVKSHISNWKRTGKLSECRRYATYFGVGFLYFLNRKKYKAIVGWQQFYALIYCFFCEMFHVKKTNMVAALNFTYKAKHGAVAGVYRWFMSKCLSHKYLDYVHVPSENYADALSAEFDYPRERIIVSTFGINDQYEFFSKLEAPAEYQKDGYALAIGRSNRDFDFLIRAWKEIAYPLVIISDTYQGKTDAPQIKILTDVAGEASKPWIANCALMVIPLDDGTICSGDTVLLTAMSAKRKILVSYPSTLAEMYVDDGENALLAPKNVETFRGKINELLYCEQHADLGERARNSFLNRFSRGSMGQRICAYINQTKKNEPQVEMNV